MSSDSDRSDVNDLFAGSGDDSKYVINVSDFIFLRFIFVVFAAVVVIIIVFWQAAREHNCIVGTLFRPAEVIPVPMRVSLPVRDNRRQSRKERQQHMLRHDHYACLW